MFDPDHKKMGTIYDEDQKIIMPIFDPDHNFFMSRITGS